MQSIVVRCLLALAALQPMSMAHAAENARMRAHFLDVGQGSAMIIETDCAAILVDTGGEQNEKFDSNQVLVDQLEDFFAGRPHLNRTFHLLVLSHPHVDHTRGVESVLQRFKVLNAVTNGQRGGSGKLGQKALHRAVAISEQSGDAPIGFEPVRVVDLPPQGLSNEVISPITCGAVKPKITALWGKAQTTGWPPEDAAEENNHSVVLRVDFGASSMLLTGDLEEKGIDGLVQRYKDTTLLDVDVYLVGHHGAANATTQPLLAAVTPKIAVISMGPAGRKSASEFTAHQHGHPRKKAIELLLPAVSGSRPPQQFQVAKAMRQFEKVTVGRAIYATGWDGAIVLEADADGQWRRVGEPPVPLPSNGPALASVQPTTNRLLDLNRATIDEIDALPMVGIQRARAIVEYRDTKGPFSSVDGLEAVKGMGKGTIKAIRHLVTAGVP